MVARQSSVTIAICAGRTARTPAAAIIVQIAETPEKRRTRRAQRDGGVAAEKKPKHPQSTMRAHFDTIAAEDTTIEREGVARERALNHHQ